MPGTVKEVELVPVPPAVVTLMGPVVAPAGTVVVIWVSEATVNGLAEVPLNLTAVAPVNPEPLIVTAVPDAPLVGEKEVTTGATSTEKTVELEPVPAGVVTLIKPVSAPTGTTAVTCESETTENVPATAPPKATEVAPVKPDPVTVTVVPTAPLVGAKDETTGAEAGCEIVNAVELVPVPLDVTTLIEPVVALDGTMALMDVSEATLKAAAEPLNVTALAPVNPVPATVTDVPLEPLVGLKELIWGGAVGWVTLKDAVLEAVAWFV